MAFNLSDPVSNRDRALIIAGAALTVVGLQIGEQYVGSAIPLGGFFLLPLFVLAAYVSRWTIFAIAIAIALTREYLGPSEWDEQGPFRLALSLVAFTGGGLFAGELIRNRRLTLEFTGKARRETQRRMQAEQEARAVVESSPAAVLTVDSGGRIAMANEATRKLFGFGSDSPEGDLVAKYIPFLATLLESEQTVRRMRTTVEARGHRLSGEEFYVQAWVSVYDGAAGPRLAAILLDVTEQLRDREEAGLRQLLSNSRIIAGAVSHELRNLAAAAKVLYHNMSEFPGVKTSADYEPLGSVIDSVLKLSTEDLSDTSEQVLEGVDVAALLQELRTIIAPKFQETGVGLEWEISDNLPQVKVDHSGLLQVFLNLAQNSRGFLEDRFGGRLRITAYALPESVLIRFSDNGPGVSSAERLFQPFTPGASSTGLGLFVSRAIVRTFGGELHHTQRPGDCCFIVELPPLAAVETR